VDIFITGILKPWTITGTRTRKKKSILITCIVVVVGVVVGNCLETVWKEVGKRCVRKEELEKKYINFFSSADVLS
jgi:uncharacterized membrane protein YqgA involved in biofilm formation